MDLDLCIYNLHLKDLLQLDAALRQEEHMVGGVLRTKRPTLCVRGILGMLRKRASVPVEPPQGEGERDEASSHKIQTQILPADGVQPCGG